VRHREANHLSGDASAADLTSVSRVERIEDLLAGGEGVAAIASDRNPVLHDDMPHITRLTRWLAAARGDRPKPGAPSRLP
jgi:hypothetical protein